MIKPGFEPVSCPTCGQMVKLYKRPLSGVEVSRLIRLYKISNRFPDRDYFHVSEFYRVAAVTGSGDFAKLRYWGLISEKPNDNPEKNHAGFWKITEAGRAFVENKKLLSKYALVYDSKFFGYMGPMQSISDRLGKRFNYQALMNGTAD